MTPMMETANLSNRPNRPKNVNLQYFKGVFGGTIFCQWDDFSFQSTSARR
jgi:hypothetical protein